MNNPTGPAGISSAAAPLPPLLLLPVPVVYVHVPAGLVEEVRAAEGAVAAHVVRAAHVLRGEGEEVVGEDGIVSRAVIPEVVEPKRVRNRAARGDGEHVGLLVLPQGLRLGTLRPTCST